MSFDLYRPFLSLLIGIAVTVQCRAAEFYEKKSTWVETALLARQQISTARLPEPEKAQRALYGWYRLKADFPAQWDWTLQDGGEDFWRWFLQSEGAITDRDLASRALSETGESGGPLRERRDALLQAKTPHWDQRWFALYGSACEIRRELRLRTVLDKTPRIVLVKSRTLRPSFFAYTEGQSDAQHERHFRPGADLCLLEFEGTYGKLRTLVRDPQGAIRDPAVSWDGRQVLFAWKKSLNEDDYHLYELQLESLELRQVTAGLGCADYEPAFLPDGNIIFASTRCVQTVDCWWTEVSNLYTCNRNGGGLRRLGFDQVHAIYPQVLDDGRIVYTRWDYNDRGQIFPQPLFQMNPDGTGQTEFYGNNSWFPTTIAHARGIPGTQKVLAILCGHHSSQAGKLAVIDPARGRQENSGVQLVAPVRETPAERIDSYGQEGPLWRHPFPLNERECLVSFAPLGWDRPEERRGDADFGIYWMHLDGRRELLAWDPRFPCDQPVPLAARSTPPQRANVVDTNQQEGTYYLRDIYAGEGLAGIQRGTIKKLRVVALDFRAAGVGNNGSAGPGGGALVSTPISVGNGSWDVKRVIGEATVYPDGSALFTVPARTPLYFQALDERGFAVQTMRSWSTLQPGEVFSCMGCHENKNTAPSGVGSDLALKAGVERLNPPPGREGGFSFGKQVQPILDRHCVRCHRDRGPVEKAFHQARSQPVLAKPRNPSSSTPGAPGQVAFSLMADENVDPVAKRRWSDSYLVLTQASPDSNAESQGSFRGNPEGRIVSWVSSQSVPAPLPPRSAGAAKSRLMDFLKPGHQGVKLSGEETRTIACWIDLGVPYCGDYLEANAWTEQELAKYKRYASKRRSLAALEGSK